MFFVLYFEDSTELYGFVQVIRCYTSTRNTADKDLNVGGGQKHPHLLKKKKKPTRLEYGWSIQAVQITVSCGSSSASCSQT